MFKKTAILKILRILTVFRFQLCTQIESCFFKKKVVRSRKSDNIISFLHFLREQSMSPRGHER